MRNLVLGMSLAAALTGCGGPNRAERLAERITTAIIANDMRPVQKEFNALVRPRLENRSFVGRLSDELNALGKFKGVHETTPRGTSDGKHTFDAKFEKATWVEDMTLDADGKVAAFHVHRSAAGPASAGESAY